jgi:hypothetical protein
MAELLVGYAEAGPLVTGLLLFPLGLAIGSFSSVLCHRLALGQSIVRPRSHCPTCHHPLSPLDLVPILSFVFLRGRCRYCTLPIPWRYPALELASGLLAAACGFAGGWGPGLTAPLLWMAGAVMLSRRWRRKSESGSSVVEVLVAVALLVGVIVPMLDLRTVISGGLAFQRQMAVTLASGKIEEVGSYNYRTVGKWEAQVIRPENVCAEEQVEDDWYEDCPVVGAYTFRRQWTLTKPVPDPGNKWLQQFTVVVTCDDCTRPVPPVRVTTYLAKVPL